MRVNSKRAERRGDRRLRDVLWGNGDLIIALEEVDLGEHLRAAEVAGEVVQPRERVAIRFRHGVQTAVVSTRAPATSRLRGDVQGGRPLALGAPDDPVVLHEAELLLGDGQLVGHQPARPTEHRGPGRWDVVLDPVFYGLRFEGVLRDFRELGEDGLGRKLLRVADPLPAANCLFRNVNK